MKMPYLEGGYAPVQSEISAEGLRVVGGELPRDLTGLFVRNGSNPRWAPKGRYHWFDGDAMLHAGLPAKLEAINALTRNKDNYLGFVEVHIEQGPILNARHLPLGVVTSINGSVRYIGEVVGMASHAGTTPMATRRDAATAVAEIALYLETRAGQADHLVATMGLLAVPGGSINVVPGRCQFSLDIRATTDDVRDACEQDVLSAIKRICERRGVSYSLEETLRVAAAPSAPGPSGRGCAGSWPSCRTRRCRAATTRPGRASARPVGSWSAS